MYKSIFTTSIALVFILSSFTQSASYGGGSGTADYPYQIWTSEQMNTIGTNSAGWNKYFTLMADIDMSAYTGTQYNIIGNTTKPFTGTFDGNGHIISNLTIAASSKDYVGLIGCVGFDGQIRNLGVKNVTITGRYCVGGLAGLNYGTLTACYAAGSVSGSEFVGGLVGFNYNTLTACYATGSVSGGSYIGGLAGYNDVYGTLTACYATGSVRGLYYVGGLAGFSDTNGTLTACFWDIQTSGLIDGTGNKPSPSGVTGKTTAQMMTLSTFTLMAWDFTTTWTMCEGTNYPRFLWQVPVGDFVCPDRVGLEDLALLVEKWLGVWRIDGDISDDTIVNMIDFSVISQHWMQTGCGDCHGADITGDGNVDIEDFLFMVQQWFLHEDASCQQVDIDYSGAVDFVDWAIFAENWLK